MLQWFHSTYYYAQYLEWEDFEVVVRRRKTKTNVVFVLGLKLNINLLFCTKFFALK
jgi:hypothetical protein